MEILAGGRLRCELDLSAQMLADRRVVRPRYILDDTHGPVFVEYDPGRSGDYGERVVAKLIALWRIKSFVMSATLPRRLGCVSFYWGPEGSSIGISNGDAGAGRGKRAKIVWGDCTGASAAARDSVRSMRRIFARRIEDAIGAFERSREDRIRLARALSKRRLTTCASAPLRLRANADDAVVSVSDAA